MSEASTARGARRREPPLTEYTTSEKGPWWLGEPPVHDAGGNGIDLRKINSWQHRSESVGIGVKSIESAKTQERTTTSHADRRQHQVQSRGIQYYNPLMNQIQKRDY
jgi:hypothetical protein